MCQWHPIPLDRFGSETLHWLKQENIESQSWTIKYDTSDVTYILVLLILMIEHARNEMVTLHTHQLCTCPENSIKNQKYQTEPTLHN